MRCFSLFHAVMAGAALLLAAEARADDAPVAPPSGVVSGKLPAPPAAAAAPVGAATKAAPRQRRRAKSTAPAMAPGTPIATYPSFRLLDDGSSRVTIEITRKIAVTEHKARGRVVYSLAGAAVSGTNERFPLPTGFFRTPIEHIEVVGQSGGSDLIIELREDSEPTYRVLDTPRGAVLQVDFPRPAADAAAPPPEAAKRSTETRRLEQKAPSDD